MVWRRVDVCFALRLDVEAERVLEVGMGIAMNGRNERVREIDGSG